MTKQPEEQENSCWERTSRSPQKPGQRVLGRGAALTPLTLTVLRSQEADAQLKTEGMMGKHTEFNHAMNG